MQAERVFVGVKDKVRRAAASGQLAVNIPAFRGSQRLPIRCIEVGKGRLPLCNQPGSLPPVQPCNLATSWSALRLDLLVEGC